MPLAFHFPSSFVVASVGASFASDLAASVPLVVVGASVGARPAGTAAGLTAPFVGTLGASAEPFVAGLGATMDGGVGLVLLEGGLVLLL